MQIKQLINSKLSLTVCTVLIAAIALFTVGCNGNTDSHPSAPSTSQTLSDVTVLGEGKTSFNFTVVDKDGKETAFLIKTDKKIVGEALQDLKLISGDEGDFGLYVKTVNGITVDYDKDKKYWAFYADGKYAASGVDTTEIDTNITYCFKVE